MWSQPSSPWLITQWLSFMPCLRGEISLPSSLGFTVHETPVALLPEILSYLVSPESAVAGISPASPQSHPFLWSLPPLLPHNNVHGNVAMPQCVRVSAHACACALLATNPESLWPARGWLCTGPLPVCLCPCAGLCASGLISEHSWAGWQGVSGPVCACVCAQLGPS